jgi:putative membrane protein
MFFGPMMMLIVIAVIVAVVLLVARWLGSSGHGHSHGPAHHRLPGQTPLDILKERFARGEIDKDEYEERRRVLAE